jgi:PAS domain-containing protein
MKTKLFYATSEIFLDRKKVDLALEERSQLYFAMFEKKSDSQLLIDPINGNIIDVNSAAGRFYGYS